jgi:hypothetical protein
VVLLKIQKNLLLDVIRDRGPEPTEFELSEDRTFTIVNHPPSRSTFQINSLTGSSFGVISKIGDVSWPYLDRIEWSDVVREFMEWVGTVKLEAEADDLWQQLGRGNGLLQEVAQEDLSNTPFTSAERAEIAQHLQEIKDYLKESHAVSAEQFARIEARLDEVKEASRRVGRKDWLLLFVGILFTLVLSAVIPSDLLQHILTMTAQGLGRLFGVGPPQLPPQT